MTRRVTFGLNELVRNGEVVAVTDPTGRWVEPVWDRPSWVRRIGARLTRIGDLLQGQPRPQR